MHPSPRASVGQWLPFRSDRVISFWQLRVPMINRPQRTPTEAAFWSRNSKPTSKRKLAKLAELYELDLRSVTTLFNAYVDFDQRENRPVDGGAKIPDAEIVHLVETQVIPEPGRFSAEDIVNWLLSEKKRCQRTSLANAFIIGIDSGRYDFRSALGSYASFYPLNNRNRAGTIKRGIEGLPEADESEERDFVYFAHRRLWKPYVIHDRADYAAFDLSRFNLKGLPAPSEPQCDNFRELLNAIRGLPHDAKLTDLQKSATGIVKGDKYDRQHVLEILGYCDILGSPDHKPMRKQFVNQLYRPLPKHFYSKEWRFPACFWSGENGVDEEAVAFWFPGYEA